MTFAITQGCCNDGACIAVCPVQCIRPRPGDPDFTTTEQLYIDPATCIDCAACMDECPVEAVHADYDIPEHLESYLQVNAEYFEENPLGDTSPLVVEQRRLPDDRPILRVAVVGAGPSALYATDELSSIKGVEVSVMERLPTPFGLVRAGVAPDHASTKLIGTRFQSVLARRNVHAFFNVEIGRHLSVDDLLAHHHAVIWAAGATGDRRLGIPGEDLPGSHAARELVAWYNGHPDHTEDAFDLSGERVVVIGNGNVALDVARALARPAQAYEGTDMADHALAALRESNVREVLVVARRGQAFGAYSTAELTALAQLDDVDLLAVADEVESTDDELQAVAPDGLTADLRRRLTVVEQAAERVPQHDRRITLRFRFTATEIRGDDTVQSIVLTRSDGTTEEVTTSLVLRAIGYRGEPVPGLPFDESAGVVPHDSGRVVDPESGAPLPGIYCSGWIKRGGTGIIGTNRTDSSETVASLLDDFDAGRLPEPEFADDAFTVLVTERQPEVVDGAAWKRIDASEKAAGKAAGRPRVKLVTIEELLAASRPTS